MYLEYGRKYEIKFYEIEGRSPVLNWLKSLDSLTKHKIERRLLRVRDGNLGDHKYLFDGLYELRFFMVRDIEFIFQLKKRK